MNLATPYSLHAAKSMVYKETWKIDGKPENSKLVSYLPQLVIQPAKQHYTGIISHSGIQDQCSTTFKNISIINQLKLKFVGRPYLLDFSQLLQFQ